MIQPAANQKTPDWVVAGQLGRLHGMDGAILLLSYCDPPEALFDYPPPLMCGTHTNALIPIRISEHIPQKNKFVVKIAGISHTSRIAQLVNNYIYIERTVLPDTNKGYYWHDLKGMKVIYQPDNGQPAIDYGIVRGLIPAGNHDLLCITPAQNLPFDAGNELLIPFIEGSYVIRVDLAERILIVAWPPEYC